MNNRINSSQSADSGDRERLLADIAALALGQVDLEEAERLQQVIEQDDGVNKLRQWKQEVAQIGELVRAVQTRDLPSPTTDLRDRLQRELGERELGERELGERELGERELAERELGERELAERELAERELEVSIAADPDAGNLLGAGNPTAGVAKPQQRPSTTARWLGNRWMWGSAIAASLLVTVFVLFTEPGNRLASRAPFIGNSAWLGSDVQTSAASDDEAANAGSAEMAGQSDGSADAAIASQSDAVGKSSAAGDLGGDSELRELELDQSGQMQNAGAPKADQPSTVRARLESAPEYETSDDQTTGEKAAAGREDRRGQTPNSSAAPPSEATDRSAEGQRQGFAADPDSNRSDSDSGRALDKKGVDTPSLMRPAPGSNQTGEQLFLDSEGLAADGSARSNSEAPADPSVKLIERGKSSSGDVEIEEMAPGIESYSLEESEYAFPGSVTDQLGSAPSGGGVTGSGGQIAPATTAPDAENGARRDPGFAGRTVDGGGGRGEGGFGDTGDGRGEGAPRSRKSRESGGRYHRDRDDDWFYNRHGNEEYEAVPENPFLRPVRQAAFSTFGIDVDTASYANLRRMINAGNWPPPAAVRIEGLINYFDYDYPEPDGDSPIAVNLELADCPWNPKTRLLRVGLKAQEIHRDERPASNLVFLLDVSGSMSNQDKLPLLKRGLQMLVDRLNENDRVSIVTYASNAGVALEPTSGDQKEVIRRAIEELQAGGSTNGSAGIHRAYRLAEHHFIEGGVNRVILGTDGDLNVGVTDDDQLVELIKRKAESGVFLSVFGFGTGNLKDAKLHKLANNGNGVYAYIDSAREAHRVLVQQMSGTLVTVAKNVKLQLEFNPAEVRGYRLIGYENRTMSAADFTNARKDAGDIGAGHEVTAFYEIVPANARQDAIASDPKILPESRYQEHKNANSATDDQPDQELGLSDEALTGELVQLRLNYMKPEANEIERELSVTLSADSKPFAEASSDFQFAAAVTAFGLVLKRSKYKGNANCQMVESIASRNLGDDPTGQRAELLDLVRRIQ